MPNASRHDRRRRTRCRAVWLASTWWRNCRPRSTARSAWSVVGGSGDHAAVVVRSASSPSVDASSPRPGAARRTTSWWVSLSSGTVPVCQRNGSTMSAQAVAVRDRGSCPRRRIRRLTHGAATTMAPAMITTAARAIAPRWRTEGSSRSGAPSEVPRMGGGGVVAGGAGTDVPGCSGMVVVEVVVVEAGSSTPCSWAGVRPV